MSEQAQVKKKGLLEYLDMVEKQGMSNAEIAAHFEHYIDSTARQIGVPVKGAFELTPLCNLKCKMCYVHLSPMQVRDSTHSLLEVEEWKEIMQQAIDLGMMEALLTGGEALLYPGFEELYLFLWNKGIRISVNSNGILINEDRVRFFQDYPPQGIQISLYGSSEDEYERVTGYRYFEKVLKNIQILRDSGIIMRIALTPNKYLIDGGIKLLELAERLQIPYSMNPGLFKPLSGTGRDSEDHDISLDEYIKLYKRQAEINKRELHPVCLDDMPNISDRQTERAIGLRCGAGRSSFAVRWSGTIHPCLALTDIAVDGKKTSFEEAWKMINYAVSEYLFPRECVGCQYEKVCPVCVVAHAAGASLGHANPYFCERARRLASEGFYEKGR